MLRTTGGSGEGGDLYIIKTIFYFFLIIAKDFDGLRLINSVSY